MPQFSVLLDHNFDFAFQTYPVLPQALAFTFFAAISFGPFVSTSFRPKL